MARTQRLPQDAFKAFVEDYNDRSKNGAVIDDGTYSKCAELMRELQEGSEYQHARNGQKLTRRAAKLRAELAEIEATL